MYRSDKTLGALSVFALAAGGMVGGGIYVALGVVVEAASQWAALSFLIAGLVAIATAHSYSHLSVKFGKSGGAFEFLEEMKEKSLAGTLSWLLLIGYVLTIALYAYAFGQYLSYAFGVNALVTKVIAVTAMAALTALNLLGLGKMTRVEITIVTLNLIALIALAIGGLFQWNIPSLTQGIESKPPQAAFVGAAAIFVSYEGFQLLTYEYETIKKARKRFVPLLTGSAISVVIIYILVALGAVFIIGAETSIAQKNVALSVAAKHLWGGAGLVIMTCAAAFATSAAINSTLYSSARLAKRVSEDGELPAYFSRTNSNDAPYVAIIGFGIASGLLAITGSLSQLVEAASLVFLVTFMTVNWICLRQTDARKFVPATGLLLGGLLGLILVWRLANNAPISLCAVFIVSIAAFFVRPWLLKHLKASN